MSLRGIISPPRSRSTPRESTRHSNNKNTNPTTNPPPSKPNYMSPRRRPINPNDLQRSLRKETQSTTTVKPTTTIRPTKVNNATQNPPKIRPSKVVAPNPNEKKSDSAINKTATKISSSTRLSSKPIAQSPRRSATPPPASKNRNNVKGAAAVASASRSDSSAAKPRTTAVASASRSDSSAAKPRTTAVAKYNNSSTQNLFHSPNGSPKIGDVGIHQNQNHDHFSAGHYLDIQDQLQQLSIDGKGKDLASIVLLANSIYESISSDTKEDQECCSESNIGSKMYQIHKEIASHHQGRNSSITSYFSKLKQLWDELANYSDLPQRCSCGSIEKLSEQMEKEKVTQFLVGLNESYSAICSQILLMKPFPSLEKVYSAIIREEKRRELVLSLESVAARLFQNNNNSTNGSEEEVENNNNVEEQQAGDQNEVTNFFPIEPLLIDLGSPVRC